MYKGITGFSEIPGDFIVQNNFQPDTHNQLTNNKFRFFLNRCPTMTYFCQRANIPSYSFGITTQSNPTGVNIRRPGTSFVYEDLNIGFSVDENMKNWLEIYNWITDIGFSYQGTSEILRDNQKTSTAYLIVMNSSYSPLLTIKYKNVFPTFLSSIDFDSSLPDTDPIISSATFTYTHYEIDIHNTPL
jgi:hypothetical protein